MTKEKRLSLFSIYEEGDGYTILEDTDGDACWRKTVQEFYDRYDRIDYEVIYDTVTDNWYGLVVYTE